MLGDLEIVKGEFPLLARRSDDIASDVSAVHVSAALSPARPAIPGASSASLMVTAGDAVDGRLKAFVTAARGVAQDARDSEASFTSTESSAAQGFRSVTPAPSSVGARGRMALRLG